MSLQRPLGVPFDTYLDFYLEQENLYPMKRKSREVTAILNMQDHAGKPLEDGILSYARYRLPDIAGDLSGVAESARDASRAGDFRTVFKVCRRPEGIQGGLKRPGGRWRLHWRIWSGQGYGSRGGCG